MPRRAGQAPKGMCLQSPTLSRAASADVVSEGIQAEDRHGPEGLMNTDSSFPASWLKGEGKSGQLLEKGEEF